MEQYYNDELYHHGVKGMKWGVRRARAKEARGYQKQLNYLDKQSTKQIGNYMKADLAAKKLYNKGVSYMNNHDNPSNRQINKVEKISKSMNEASSRRNAAKKAQETIDSKTWKVIGEAMGKGYSVTNKQIYRDAERGRTIAQNLLASPIGHIAINSVRVPKYSRVYNGQAPWAVQGNKYKVR